MSDISKKIFKKFIETLPFSKVVQKTTGTPQGWRLWPSQTSRNDKQNNFRADKGATLPDGRQEIIIQANKNAENKGVRESAQKDSHRIVAKVVVDPEQASDRNKFMDDALESFDENN